MNSFMFLQGRPRQSADGQQTPLGTAQPAQTVNTSSASNNVMETVRRRPSPFDWENTHDSPSSGEDQTKNAPASTLLKDEGHQPQVPVLKGAQLKAEIERRAAGALKRRAAQDEDSEPPANQPKLTDTQVDDSLSTAMVSPIPEDGLEETSIVDPKPKPALNRKAPQMHFVLVIETEKRFIERVRTSKNPRKLLYHITRREKIVKARKAKKGIQVREE